MNHYPLLTANPADADGHIEVTAPFDLSTIANRQKASSKACMLTRNINAAMHAY